MSRPKDVPFVAKGVNGVLTITPDTVTISRKGSGFLAVGSIQGEKTIRIAHIAAIQFKQAGINLGYIQFSFMGGQENKSGLFKASSDENAVTFNRRQKRLFEQARNLLETYRSTTTTSPVEKRPPDLVSQLERLGALRDRGVITEDEFQASNACCSTGISSFRRDLLLRHSRPRLASLTFSGSRSVPKRTTRRCIAERLLPRDRLTARQRETRRASLLSSFRSMHIRLLCHCTAELQLQFLDLLRLHEPKVAEDLFKVLGCSRVRTTSGRSQPGR